MTLKEQLQEDVKQAMRARDKARLGVLRLMTAAVKQQEVDHKAEGLEDLDDSGVLAVLDKMAKQRRESLEQYRKAGRDDLADQEQFELDLIAGYLPEPLSQDEIEALINEAIGATGASAMKDMGGVMGWLKPRLQGRADMKSVSAAVRARLGA
jgi:uncharacterized protein YqeY